MANEPQREIEKDLLAYKQRRREQSQTGAPFELHPATRKMLQGEAARTASRPLITSEEAAKNFVRSFVLSNQQPNFLTRHKRRVIWGGAMFACLALVLAVLRNDPHQAAQQRTFSDKLPPPPQAPEPLAARPQTPVSGNKPQTVAERPAQARKLVSAPGAQAVARDSATATGGPARTIPRPTATASAPLPALSRAASAPAATQGFVGGKPAERAATDALTGDKISAAKPGAGPAGQLAKTLKSEQGAAVMFVPETKRADEDAKLKPNTDLRGGAKNVAASERQQFRQLDNRAGYRQNFNSPPVPQVMQDFAFERTGDRVRIVDADGSTYEGTVVPAPAGKEAETDGRQPAQAAAPQNAYRFYANGVNRKLNQSVELHGEWLPAAREPSAAPALQPANLGAVRLEMQAAEKKDRAATNGIAANAAPAQQTGLPSGRISGRAVVGGRSEFDFNAVSR
ncbi:MAG: hypothetical protein WCS99_07965 [Limisphaerales bacterium]